MRSHIKVQISLCSNFQDVQIFYARRDEERPFFLYKKQKMKKEAPAQKNIDMHPS